MIEKLKSFDFKPTVILAIIVTVTTILLVVMERSIKVDESVLSGAMKEKCVELMGDGEFEVVLDWLEAGYAVQRPRGVAKMIINTDNNVIAFQVLAKGYEKDGLNMLIVMNSDGSVKDLTVYQNGETPGIGSKVEERSFLEEFIGLSENTRIIKGATRNDSEIAAITGATKSSRGVSDAVNIAINIYAELFLEAGGEA